MNLQFYGAARTVTGSMHLLSVNGKQILLDCGLYQGKREEAFQRNRHFPFKPESIDAVILSHAHIDHSGNIPTLVRKGYNGPIYSTPATRDLCSAMLQDSAHLQEKDTEFVNRKRAKKQQPLFNPLYNRKDALNAIQLFRTVAFDKPLEISQGVTVTFRKAGHILGASMIELQLKEGGHSKTLVFTGDIGRKEMPVLPDPYCFEKTDLLLMETTYGNRLHKPEENVDAHLIELMNEAVKNKSKIIIPAFAVDRTQTFVYRLNKLCKAGLCPNIPIYVDSPLALNVTQIYRLHPECLDEDALDFLEKNGDPFGFEKLHYTHTVEESMALNNKKGPMIIISASGMCEGGRILHHLRNNIQDPKNIILMIGYAAEQTLGKRIIEKDPIVKIFGEPVELNAKVVVMNNFSGHADKNELLDFLKCFKEKPEKMILVHGDETQSLSFAETLQTLGYTDVSVPKENEVINF